MITPNTSVKVAQNRIIQPCTFSQKRLSLMSIPGMEMTKVAKTKMAFTIAAVEKVRSSVTSICKKKASKKERKKKRWIGIKTFEW
jgi:hypothetical protein